MAPVVSRKRARASEKKAVPVLSRKRGRVSEKEAIPSTIYRNTYRRKKNEKKAISSTTKKNTYRRKKDKKEPIPSTADHRKKVEKKPNPSTTKEETAGTAKRLSDEIMACLLSREEKKMDCEPINYDTDAYTDAYVYPSLVMEYYKVVQKSEGFTATSLSGRVGLADRPAGGVVPTRVDRQIEKAAYLAVYDYNQKENLNLTLKAIVKANCHHWGLGGLFKLDHPGILRKFYLTLEAFSGDEVTAYETIVYNDYKNDCYGVVKFRKAIHYKPGDDAGPAYQYYDCLYDNCHTSSSGSGGSSSS